MKRRGFLGSLFGLVAVPVAAKVPVAPAAAELPPLVVFTPGPIVFDEADRICNPPIIVADNGDFMRTYREEFIAGFKAKQSLLRDVVNGRR